MLRLHLDYNNGIGLIPCPTCGQPMLLGAEKMNRWLVAYSSNVRVRREGRRAMLVCPDYGCDYWEPVEVVRQRADAVIFNPLSAGSVYVNQQGLYGRTLEEYADEIHRLEELYRTSRSPKLPSAIRAWRERFRFAYSSILRGLENSLEEGSKACLTLRQDQVSGWVKEIHEHAVIIERADTGELERIRLWDLTSVVAIWERGWPEKRFDFGKDVRAPEGVRPYHRRPILFLVIGGQSLALDGADRYGLCDVHTEDPEVAARFGLIQSGKRFIGEIPGALADRFYRVLTFVHVLGYRLYVTDFTNHPDWVKVRTRHMEAARRLLLWRETFVRVGPRRQLDWVGYVHRSQVERWEEVQLQLKRPRARRR